MAAAAKRSEDSWIFWSNDEEEPLVFIPGADGIKTVTSSSQNSKMRPTHALDGNNQNANKMSGRKQQHLQRNGSQGSTKKKVTIQQSDIVPPLPTLLQPPNINPHLSQINYGSIGTKGQISLKDLCNEDKRRIANLIEELARVSEEKEESVQKLHDEQGNFERKIQQLEQQNLMIAQERENLQQQYRECQELLRLYQQYLAQEQAKLNQSIVQLSQAPTHSEVLNDEEAPSRTFTSRARGSVFDGSYLSLTAAASQQAQACRTADSTKGAMETSRNPIDSSFDGALSSSSEPVKRLIRQNGEFRQSHQRFTCERCQNSCSNSTSTVQQWRSDSQVNCHHDTHKQTECKRPHNSKTMSSDDKESQASSQLDHEDWEEKKHQLLLQKMQLELEREKLQTRLAEQKKLSRQTEELRQSRLDHSRVQQPNQVHPSSSTSRSGGPEPGDSNVAEHARAHSSEENGIKKSPETAAVLSANGNLDDPLERFRRDTAQVDSSSHQCIPASTSGMRKTPATRMDCSVVELLDIFSPVSCPEQCKSGARRHRTPQHKLAHAAVKAVGGLLLSPAGNFPQSVQQDLEESQILEDIFFVC